MRHLGHTLVFFGAALWASVDAATVYVSPDGSEAGAGSRTDPRRYIKTQLAALAPGDSLVLLPGIYSADDQGDDGLSGLQLLVDDVTVTAAVRGTAVLDFADQGSAEPFLWQTTTCSNGTITGLVFRNWSTDEHFIYNEDCDGFRVGGCRFESVAPTGLHSIIVNRFAEDAVVDSCDFEGRGADSRYYAISLEGIPGSEDRSRVSACRFNSFIDLADVAGRGAGVQALGIDSLVIERCDGFNAGSNDGGSNGLNHFVYLADVARATVRYLQFQRYLGDADQTNPLNDANGIKIGSRAGEPSNDIDIYSCGFWGAGHGIHVGNQSMNVDISYVWCDSTYDDAIFFDDGASDSSVEFLVSHHAQDNGVDVQGTNIEVRNCTIVRSRNAALNVADPATGLVCRDNLIYDVRDPEVRPDELLFAASTGGYDIDHTLWFDPGDNQDRYYVDGVALTWPIWQAMGQDANGLVADPHFVDPDGRAWPIGNDAFALCLSSPALGAGEFGGAIGALGSSGCVVTVDVGSPVRGRLPNPVSLGATRALAVAAHQPVTVFDVAGRRVRRLPARAEVVWDLRDGDGRRVRPGVYFVSVPRTPTQKLVVTR